MRSQFKRFIVVAIGTVAAIATLWSTTNSVVGQSPTTYKAPRTADGQADLSGFWQALNAANWDLEDHPAQAAPYQNLVGTYLAQPAGMSVVEGGVIPYKPEALVKRKENLDRRLGGNPFDRNATDPEARCFQGGVPRITYMPFPFQIVQTRNKVFIGYEYGGSARVVHLDQTRDDLLEVDSYMGQSVGRWEGDTLVVDVAGFSDSLWLDRAGNFMSPGAHVIERYTPRSPSNLMYEATIEDPSVFTRPWKISMPLYRRIDPNMQLLEFQCIPFSEEFMYGALRKKSAAR
jgi:hypothetical protein